MPFEIVATRPAPDRNYTKVGRLIAGEDGQVHLFLDGKGEILTIPRTDILCALQGLSIQGLVRSDTGKRLIVIDRDGREYQVLVSQVREMFRSWQKKKAAVFVDEERVNTPFS